MKDPGKMKGNIDYIRKSLGNGEKNAESHENAEAVHRMQKLCNAVPRLYRGCSANFPKEWILPFHRSP
jgi:hypothetical protein